MSAEQNLELVRLLTEIRDQQRLQLERQAEALAVQREQFALAQKQMERTERIQDRAEVLQEKSTEMMRTARKTIAVILPIVVALTVLLLWMMLF